MKANSLNEYMLPLALITVVGVFIIHGLGSNLSQMLVGMIQHKNKIVSSQILESHFTPNAGSVNLVVSIKKTNNTIQEWVIPNFPANMSAAVEVDGVNGNTEKIAAFLKQLAETLEAQGEESANDTAIIRKISNSGYSAAALQKSLEDGIAEANGQPFGNIEIMDNSLSPPQKQNIRPLSLLYFVNLQNTIPSAQLIKNPAIRAVVAPLSQQIVDSTQYSALYVRNGLNNNAMKVETNQLTRTVMTQSSNSTRNSTDICNSSEKNESFSLRCISKIKLASDYKQ